MFIRMERCTFCNRKVLLLFNCKCNGNYCIKCKDSLKHNCNFDYKKDQQEKLKKLNPTIESKKLDNI